MLLVEKVPQVEFAYFVLNVPKRCIERILNFETNKATSMNVVHVNAIYRWLNDDNRLEKLNEAKKCGEFFYLTTDNIDESVLNYFYILSN